MNRKIDTISLNLHGLKRVKGILYDSIENNDLICLQETCLRDFEDNILHDSLPGFEIMSKTSLDNTQMNRGRPFGGLAIVWKTTMSKIVNSVALPYDNMMAITLTIGAKKLYIVNVYVPFNCNANEDIRLTVANLLSVRELNDCDEIIIMEDFNMHVESENFMFLKSLCKDANLCMYDHEQLDKNCYTYISEINGAVRWLDYCIVSNNIESCFLSCNVLTDVLISDHLPMKLSIQVSQFVDENSNKERRNCNLNWGNQKCIYDYQNHMERLYNEKMGNLALCKIYGCHGNDHNKCIDKWYECLVECMQICSEVQANSNNQNSMNKPGWNIYVSQKYKRYREEFYKWVGHGKNKTGPQYERMVELRKVFKSALRTCKLKEKENEANAMATDYLCHDFVSFLSKLKKHDKKVEHFADSIDRCTGKINVCDQWKSIYEKHFSLNNSIAEEKKDELFECFDNYDIDYKWFFCEDDIGRVINALGLRKAAGPDNLRAENFRYLPDNVQVGLVSFFNSCLAHCYLPNKLRGKY